MEKMKKDWQEKGSVSVYLKKEDLTTIALKLEKMTSLPKISCFTGWSISRSSTHFGM